MSTRARFEETKRSTSEYVLRVATPSGTVRWPFPSCGKITIGRGDEVNLRLGIEFMSRRHAMLSWERGKLFLSDIGSANGTTLRGDQLTAGKAEPLEVGELFYVGEAALMVTRTGDEPEPLAGRAPFDDALQAAVAAYESHQSKFGVLYVKAEGAADWGDFVLGLACKDDACGFVSENELCILMRHRGEAQLLEIRAFLKKALLGIDPKRRVELRCCPEDGKTVAELAPREVSATARDLTRRPPPTLHSVVMQQVHELVDRVAPSTASILILGETGVGKEVLARRIHDRSDRSGGPLVTLNCAALPETLLESELFGYERGAFTGADRQKIGLIEAAHGGTVFLDEVGEMPLMTQAKLLRVLENRSVLRIGALRPTEVDFRLIAATNRDLQQEIAAGRFRGDLYFRIKRVSVTIPPLRKRREEIAPLVTFFLDRAATNLGKRSPLVSPEVMSLLEAYHWPGNIRELRASIERSVLLCRSGVLLPEHLPEDIAGFEGGVRRHWTPSEAPPPTPSASTRPPDSDPGDDPTSDYHRVVKALQDHGGNQTRAAAALGMKRHVFLAQLDRFQIPRPRKAKG